MNDKKVLVLVTFILCFIFPCVSQEVITGVWGINLGDTKNQVLQKLNEKYPGKAQSDMNGIFVENVKLGDENFQGVQFIINNNQLNAICFSNIIQYENGFTEPLSFKKAQNWLDNNRSKVVQSLNNHVVDMLKAKYGNPSKGSSDAFATWKDSKGNIIEITLEEELDIANDEYYYNNYGALPAFLIMVAYVKNNGNNQF